MSSILFDLHVKLCAIAIDIYFSSESARSGERMVTCCIKHRK